MSERISDDALKQLFLDARTHNAWTDKDVPDSLLHELVEIVKMGPTSANCSPARILFVKSREAKKRLEPHLSEGNRAKTMSAPVCAIIGHDLEFYTHLPKLFPHNLEARSWFEGDEDKVFETAFRNGSLQGADFILGARAFGLDTGPMSGFDSTGVDNEVFSGTQVKSNFLCSLGYGDPSGLFARSPRFAFDEMAEIL